MWRQVNPFCSSLFFFFFFWSSFLIASEPSCFCWLGALPIRRLCLQTSEEQRKGNYKSKQEAPFKDLPSTGMTSECGSIKIRPLLEWHLVLLRNHCSEGPWNFSLQTSFRGPQEKSNSLFKWCPLIFFCMRLLFRVKRTRATVGETCVLVPVSLLNSCVTLDKSHTLYILHFLLYRGSWSLPISHQLSCGILPWCNGSQGHFQASWYSQPEVMDQKGSLTKLGFSSHMGYKINVKHIVRSKGREISPLRPLLLWPSGNSVTNNHVSLQADPSPVRTQMRLQPQLTP